MIKYILVEGVTDVSLVKYICLKNSITENFNNFVKSKNLYKYKDLIIVDLGGQDKLEIYLKMLQQKEKLIQNLAIIQDADNDFEKSKENINKAIKNSKIDSKKIQIFLTPNNKDLGDLETLLLSTIQENNIVKCFDDYKNCLTDEQDIYEKALNKGQVYAYAMYSQTGKDLHKPQDSFISKKGIDTQLWDLDREEFEPIVKFVLDIFGVNNI